MRLIDADALIDYLQMIPIDLGYREVEEIEEYVRSMPTMYAVPVVHAHWAEGSNIGFYHCSNCGGAAAGIVEWAQKYCLHCGAKMDEVNV